MEKHPKFQSGFTLVELIVALTITAVLLGVGVPSFVSAIKNSRMNSNYSAIVGSLYLARSEAVKQNKMVSVCARATDTVCGDNWENGWITFVDLSGGGNTAGVIDASDTILAIQGSLSGSENTIVSTALPKNTAGVAEQDFIRYRNSGDSNWVGGTFLLCDDRGADYAQALNIVLTGDIRKARAGKDFQNNTLTCS